MNGKDPPSAGGQQPKNKNSFGELKNQGRKGFGQNSPDDPGRSRANAVFQAPTGRERANAVFDTPGRTRSNATTDINSGFKQIKNEGRSPGEHPQDRPSTPQFGNLQNQGRSTYQSAKDNRAELTPKQQAGFNLVSGFMEKIMKEADRANSKNHHPSDKRNQQGQSGKPNPQDEEDKRRLSIQSSKKDDDEDISAGDFFKRLQGALADPAKFRKEAAQRAAAKQENNPPPSQTRERGGTIHSGSDSPNPLNDPAGYKRHQQQQPQPGKSPQQRPPGGGQDGPGKQQNQQQTQPAKMQNKPSIKPSPRKK